MDTDTPDDWVDLTWRFALNGVPVSPWTDIVEQVGNIAIPFSKSLIRIPEASTLQLQFKNDGSVAHDVRAMFHGYFYSMERNTEFAGGEFQV